MDKTADIYLAALPVNFSHNRPRSRLYYQLGCQYGDCFFATYMLWSKRSFYNSFMSDTNYLISFLTVPNSSSSVLWVNSRLFVTSMTYLKILSVRLFAGCECSLTFSSIFFSCLSNYSLIIFLMVITRPSWSSFALDVEGVSCAEACLVCMENFGVNVILFDICLKLTMLSALTEIIDANNKLFKVHTDVNN